MTTMLLSGLALSRRLERAEGYACVRFAEARQRLFPDGGSAWMESGGAQVVFDGIDSPVTQTFGLGIFEPLSEDTLAEIERFFFDRGAPVHHEVSPLAGVDALTLLCTRGYRPVEISNVLYRTVEPPEAYRDARIAVRVTGPSEAHVWADVSARGWAAEHPELGEYLRGFGAIAAARQDSPCFLAEWDGVPGAAGSLSIHEGVALFSGSATVPELRRRGLQSSLIRERMRFALDQGCDVAMMVAQAGSDSQRNAERNGFRIAYTRIKWQLAKVG